MLLEVFFLFHKSFVIYKILYTLKLSWFTIDSSTVRNKGVQFFFHDICHFFVCIADCIKICKRIIKKGSLNISAHLPMIIILMNHNLVRTFFDIFYPNYGVHPWK